MSGKLATVAVFGLIAALGVGGCTAPGTPMAAASAPTAAPVPAYGGNVTTTGGVPGYVGSAQSTVPGCPYIVWRLARANGQVHGIVYYSDLSGMSMATGTVTPDGVFNLTLTPQMGNGPTGTISGHRMPDGSGEATLTGSGCANTHVVMQGVSDLTQYHESDR